VNTAQRKGPILLSKKLKGKIFGVFLGIAHLRSGTEVTCTIFRGRKKRCYDA
jgi:hypothetical protein